MRVAASCCEGVLLKEHFTGALHKIDGIIRKEHYVEMLKQNLKTLDRKLKLRCKWVFQMDNDPKHTAKLVTKWLKNNKANVLEP